MGDRCEFWELGEEVMAVGEQRAVAVYPNPDGDLVIRQERAWDEEEDHIIIVRIENAERLAQAIIRAATEYRP